MNKFTKALMVAAISFGAATLYTDSGLALGSDQDSAITADDIVINPEVIAENNQQLPPNEIIFVPGTGETEQDTSDEENPEVDSEEENVVTATSLRELVALQDTSIELSEEMQCLAGTVYFESKGESLEGQLAVARVVLARAASNRFPNTICGVVYQRKQFSFVRGGRMPRISKNKKTWRNAVAIAKIASDDAWENEVEGALFFHATYVSPRWKLKRIGRVDKHIFYR